MSVLELAASMEEQRGTQRRHPTQHPSTGHRKVSFLWSRVLAHVRVQYRYGQRRAVLVRAWRSHSLLLPDQPRTDEWCPNCAAVRDRAITTICMSFLCCLESTTAFAQREYAVLLPHPSMVLQPHTARTAQPIRECKAPRIYIGRYKNMYKSSRQSVRSVGLQAIRRWRINNKKGKRDQEKSI